ncbi:MAG TPA: bacillithiol biosynthesis cysteine-adding enzyme BshC [Terriglobia bacterium]
MPTNLMECQCIPYSRLPKTSTLFLDYVDHFERVASFYGGGTPFALASYQTVAGALNHPAALRSQVASVLMRQNRALGASEATLANLERLAEPGTMAVVTGQQVGLFSGPAFTLYKALTAVHLAQWLSEQGLPCLPVFWLATEDHDLAEVASTALLDNDYNPVMLSDPGIRPAPQCSVGYAELTSAITEELNRLESALPAGETRQQLLSDLRDSYRPGARWGEAFARFLARLFGRWGVILLDALDPELHHLSASIYAKAVAEAPELNARLLQRSQSLVAAGYHAQVHVGPESTLLFSEHDGNRVALRLVDGGKSFKLEGGERFTGDKAQASAEAQPERWTPNALFRPVVQDLLLPTVAYVAGSAELAYHGQSSVLYPALGRPQPVIVPRASFTLVDPRSQRLLKRYKLSVEDVWQGEAHLRQKIAAVGFAEGWQARLDQSEQEIERLLDRLRADLAALDPTLLEGFQRARKRALYQFERLKGKITRAAFTRSEVLRRHEAALRAFLTPGGGLQERGLGGAYFLGREGYGILDGLLARITLRSAAHQMVLTREAAAGAG